MPASCAISAAFPKHMRLISQTATCDFRPQFALNDRELEPCVNATFERPAPHSDALYSKMPTCAFPIQSDVFMKDTVAQSPVHYGSGNKSNRGAYETA